MTHPKIFAVCGKGGVGKTSISAILVKMLMEDKTGKVLAIDADPAIGLATSLGFQGTKTVDSIRKKLIHRLDDKTAASSKEINEQLDYELLDAIEERDNLAFLSIGRPETEGCYCRINSLLRDLIASVSRNFDTIIIDGEAGIEQVNRRVMETVTHLLLVSDGSKKGINVAETIATVAKKVIKYKTTGILFNRINKEEFESLKSKTSLETFGWIPENKQLRQLDINGEILLEWDVHNNLRNIHFLKQLIKSGDVVD